MASELNLSAPQAARQIGVTTATVRQWARDGKIEVIVLPSGRILIPQRVVDDILKPKQKEV